MGCDGQDGQGGGIQGVVQGHHAEPIEGGTGCLDYLCCIRQLENRAGVAMMTLTITIYTKRVPGIQTLVMLVEDEYTLMLRGFCE